MASEPKGSLHKSVVEAFIRAYNCFDIGGMMEKVHEEVIFENIIGGQTTLEVKGKEALRKQAHESATHFKRREQKILSITEDHNRVTINIAFRGLLKKDIPGGKKAGKTIRMYGQSMYAFKNDLIIEIRDII